MSPKTRLREELKRLTETTGTGPARCAFSVGLEFGDTPCAIAPMMPAYAKVPPSLKLRHDKKLRRTSRLGKPEGEGRVVQGMSGEAAR